MSDENRKYSKFLSYVLRHHPEEIGIQLDENGWTDVAILLRQAQAHQRPLTYEKLLDIVENNDKKRFTFSEDKQKIRAAQGHSTSQVAMKMNAVQPPEILYHGTATRFVESILVQGLLKQSRHHVHLSADPQTAIKVGQRHGKPVVLKIDSGKMHAQGISFYLSDNGVWLCEHVAPEFLSILQD